MYEHFYGLRERPFEITPDLRYLHLTPMHREALGAIQYGVTARRGIVVVMGEAGTGKTSIARAALRALRESKVRQIFLANPMLSRQEFFRFLARAFRLPMQGDADKVELLRLLEAVLRDYHARGRPVVLVIDEAQSLPDDLLEEIRLLANIETATTKLLQVVLAGQPELGVRLNAPALRPLKQRIAVRATLRPLDLQGTAAMVAGRIRIAGGVPSQVFTPGAVEAIYRHSGGIPRVINVICDNALLTGYASELRPVPQHVVREVCLDLDLPDVVTTPARHSEPESECHGGGLES